MNPKEIAELKTELQSLGVRLPEDFPRREGGAGPSEGITLIIEGVPATVPTVSWLASGSPFRLEFSGGGARLFRGQEMVTELRLGGQARFYAEKDPEGRSLRQHALLHGVDCLATTVSQVCAYASRGRGCRFCGIGISLARGDTVAEKDPAILALAAKRAVALDGVKHVTLTTGTQDSPDRGIAELARAAWNIKDATGLPVHAQTALPGDLGWLENLKENGVDTLGIHVETFSPRVLKRVSPSKHAAGYSRFIAAWQRAVEIFGWGQVSSFIIIGLGENEADTLRGAGLLAELGVYPYLVPLRPIPGTPLGKTAPPAPGRMKKLYREVKEILSRHRLSAGAARAGCVRCGACSALPQYENLSD